MSAPSRADRSPALDLSAIEALPVDGLTKGLRPGRPSLPLAAIGRQGWSLLREDLGLPVVVLKESALAHNGAWMRRFLAATGTSIAPHGKTTMAPQLFARQLADGAFAITLATVHQVALARRFGVPRILLANEIGSRADADYVLEEMRRDPAFELYAFVDSLAGVRLLAEAARAAGPGRPLKLLLECGFAGGRAGCRALEGALAVARAVKAEAPVLALIGVAGFEGIVPGEDDAARETAACNFLDSLVAMAEACAEADLFADGAVWLSAGGSHYFDLAAERFARARLGRPARILLRPGCYLTHDSVHYGDRFPRLLARSAPARGLGPGLRPALELWAKVLSRPEPGRAVLGFGKRDCSHDQGPPQPLSWFRVGSHAAPQPIGDGHRVAALNDQHALLDLPADSPLAFGDLVACGVSHPCLTFDRWPVLPIVDDRYGVTGAIRTFF
jgi:D-serine dehydratase